MPFERVEKRRKSAKKKLSRIYTVLNRKIEAERLFDKVISSYSPKEAEKLVNILYGSPHSEKIVDHLVEKLNKSNISPEQLAESFIEKIEREKREKSKIKTEGVSFLMYSSLLSRILHRAHKLREDILREIVGRVAPDYKERTYRVILSSGLVLGHPDADLRIAKAIKELVKEGKIKFDETDLRELIRGADEPENYLFLIGLIKGGISQDKILRLAAEESKKHPGAVNLLTKLLSEHNIIIPDRDKPIMKEALKKLSGYLTEEHIDTYLKKALEELKEREKGKGIRIEVYLDLVKYLLTHEEFREHHEKLASKILEEAKKSEDAKKILLDRDIQELLLKYLAKNPESEVMKRIEELSKEEKVKELKDFFEKVLEYKRKPQKGRKEEK